MYCFHCVLNLNKLFFIDIQSIMYFLPRARGGGEISSYRDDRMRAKINPFRKGLNINQFYDTYAMYSTCNVLHIKTTRKQVG